MSKVLAQMMIKCNSQISDDQVAVLQQFKANAIKFDYTQAAYMSLIDLDWDSLRHQSEGGELAEGEGTGPVEMSQQEILMSNEMEDYSDELKREQDLEARKSIGKTQIAFFDIENMSVAT